MHKPASYTNKVKGKWKGQVITMKKKTMLRHIWNLLDEVSEKVENIEAKIDLLKSDDIEYNAQKMRELSVDVEDNKNAITEIKSMISNIPYEVAARIIAKEEPKEEPKPEAPAEEKKEEVKETPVKEEPKSEQKKAPAKKAAPKNAPKKTTTKKAPAKK